MEAGRARSSGRSVQNFAGDRGQEGSGWLHRYEHLVVLIAGAAAVLLYAGYVALSEPGFPLDDSWIHQTYARNLAADGKWEFAPGISTNGSTSPSWTLLLVIGYLLSLPLYLWAYFVGWLCLIWLAFAAMSLWKRLWPKYSRSAVWIGLCLVFAWPLVWSAASGMETLFFTALTIQIFALYAGIDRPKPPYLAGLGLLSGLATATRPDGLALTLLISTALMLSTATGKIRLRVLLNYFLGVLLILIPYFLFNLGTSGTYWPNTLYAKQAEYRFLWEQALSVRYLQLLYFSLGGPPTGWRGISGVQLLLLPGIFAAFYTSIRVDVNTRRLYYTVPLIWALGHVLIYAWRLPVTYQHGRYLWPTLPVWFIFGLAGWMYILDYTRQRLKERESQYFILSSGLKITFGILMIIFLFLGLRAYSQDVAFVNGEMVDVARWLQNNTPEHAIVAAHDIGAIGYIAERQLIDLAGLVSPEVIPYLDDEAMMANYILNSAAQFVVTAPGWSYDELMNNKDIKLLYVTNLAWTRDQGFNNMAVYQMSN